MYSLICGHSKVSSIPYQQIEDMELSAYRLKIPNRNLGRAEKIKAALERSEWAKAGLLSMTLLGTCMVIGDGILTTCISVLSAVGGVKKIDASLSNDVVAMISLAILVLLFSIQRFGTHKVGYTFAPAILLWYSFIGTIGFWNLIKHDTSVLKAFNPIYIFWYFKRDPKHAWISLGGGVLCMTEKLMADKVENEPIMTPMETSNSSIWMKVAEKVIPHFKGQECMDILETTGEEMGYMHLPCWELPAAKWMVERGMVCHFGFDYRVPLNMWPPGLVNLLDKRGSENGAAGLDQKDVSIVGTK